MDCLEQRSAENISPEKKKQKLEDSSSPDLSVEIKKKLEDSNSRDPSFEEEKKLEDSSSDPSVEEEPIDESEETLLLSEEEKHNLLFNPADYSSPEERERDIRSYCEGLRAREARDKENRLRNKKKYELPKEKQKTHGWYGMVLADDSDEYSDAEERAEDLLKYYSQVKSSRGFDVEHFPKTRLCGMIVPVEVEGSGSLEDDPFLGGLSISSIEKFNKEKGRQYQFNRVIKSTARTCSGAVFYITFEATEADSAIIFEASVYRMIDGDIEVLAINSQGDLEGKGI